MIYPSVIRVHVYTSWFVCNKSDNSICLSFIWSGPSCVNWRCESDLRVWQTYCDRPSRCLVCTQPAVSHCPPHHRWCRAGRGRGSFRGRRRYHPRTPRTPCHGRVRSARTHPGPLGTLYMARTGRIARWRKSCSCRRRWRRWSRCRASPCASGRYTQCRACTALCDCSSLRRSHLQVRGQVKGDETEKWEGGNKRRGKELDMEVRRWKEQEIWGAKQWV